MSDDTKSDLTQLVELATRLTVLCQDRKNARDQTELLVIKKQISKCDSRFEQLKNKFKKHEQNTLKINRIQEILCNDGFISQNQLANILNNKVMP